MRDQADAQLNLPEGTFKSASARASAETQGFPAYMTGGGSGHEEPPVSADGVLLTESQKDDMETKVCNMYHTNRHNYTPYTAYIN
jgi:hypothetical protein